MRRLLPLLLLFAACSPSGPEVVVYASVDEIYARAIFDAFQRETGVRVRAVFDTEEAKALGLANRVAAEKGRAGADVFWNGEAVRTARLAALGRLEPYRPPTADGIGPAWRDPGDAWTGFGARARVIVYAPARVPSPPRSIRDLAKPEWRDRVAMANPMFGTTAAHAAALAQAMGEEPALALLAALKANGVRFVGGNSHVRDLVARGDRDLGLTDSDDVWVGKDRGDAIEMVVPDDTLLIPNTAALVRGAPHPAEARRFLDFLLRAETEALLARGRSRQIPVRGETPPGLRVDWAKLATSEAWLDRVRKALDL
ncbi:MAG TPA: extracellular solute-binding protein [Planctomycetota bacterium]